MADQWYFEWASKHATVFGFPDKGIEALVAWAPHWEKTYTLAELEYATAELIHDRRTDREGRPLLRWHEEHRIAIPASIASYRAKRKYEATRGDPVRECSACGDTGWRPVPHPGKNDRGELRPFLSNEPHSHNRFGSPVFLELSVVCSCPRGDRLVSTPALRFDTYETRYPNWRLVAEHVASLRNIKTLSASEISIGVEQIKRLLAASMSMPRREAA